MSQKTRAIFLLLTIVAVLFVSAFGTTNVYADDGTPPPPPAETGEVDPPPTGEAEPAATEPAAETEAPPTDETGPVATEAPVTEPSDEAVPSEDVPVVEEAPVVEEQQPAEEEAAPILEQVPDNTVVTVLNAEGEAQPLTSQESADAIATSDPIWCPSTAISPVPGQNGCTGSYSSFTELLTFLKANETDPAYQQAGTIYVQMGGYAGPESSIDFDSYNFMSLNQQDLTIQGGWNPADYSTNGTTTLNNVPVVIGVTNPWIGSLTFNNLVLTGNSNSDQTGLTVVSQNSITLSNVQVTNFGGGADLEAGGDVLVYDSEFSQNKKFGAKIKSGGFVEVMNSNFNNNTDNGPDDGFGLKVDSQGGTFLGMVNANNNEEFGADVTSAGSVTVWNSVFSGNIAYTTECKWQAKSCHWVCVKKLADGGYGLKVVSTGEGSAGEIYLKRVTANDNYLFGAHLEGTIVTVEGELVDGVMVGNVFSGNGLNKENPQGYGLEVLSTEGDVTLRNVEANNNQLFGANIQAKGKVIVTNSFFNGNKAYYKSCSWQAKGCHEVCVTEYVGYGLNVVTDGGIQLVNVEANENNLFGAHLEGALTIVDYGVFSNNGSDPFVLNNLTGRGLEIVSTSEVILSQIYANNNQAFGADIQAAGNVELATGFFNGHKVYTYSGNCTDEDKKSCHYEPCVKTLVGGGYGLRIDSGGSVALADIEANDNYLFGMEVIAAEEVALDQGKFNNNKEGLKIKAKGVVELAGVTANNNKIAGATIISAFGAVKISNSIFSGNYSLAYGYCKGKTYYGYGLKVVTTDTIDLTNVVADNNALYGAYLEGNGVFVGGVANSFSNNGTGTLSDHTGKGLEIVSTGGSTVSLTNVTASGNQEFGAKIKADGTVLVSYSVFSGNHSYASSCTSKSSSYGKSTGSGKSCSGKECTKTYYGYGLEVVTTGDISVSNVEANENYLFGAHLNGANVTVSNSTFSFNVSPTEKDKTPTGRGLEVKSTGNATLRGVDASNNQLFGATVEAGGEVTVLSSTFMNNKYSTATSCKGTKSAGYGLKVVATESAIASPITLENVTASGNGAEGAILQGETAAIAVTDSTFNNNGADGLNVTAGGNVTLTNVTAIGNKDDGVDVKGVCTSTVNVSGGEFKSNSKYGIKVVDTVYAPDAITPPTFSGNGSGNVFQSGCGNSGGGSGSGNSGGGNNGSNWWYWWWYWHRGR